MSLLTSNKETVPTARPPLETVSNFFHLVLTRLAKCTSPSSLLPQLLEFRVCVFGLAACIGTTKYHSRMLQAANQNFVTGCHSVVPTISDGTGEQARATKRSGTVRLHTRCNVLLSVQLYETRHVVLYWTSNNGVTVYSILMYCTGQVTIV
jgi:hypothetical protein